MARKIFDGRGKEHRRSSLGGCDRSSKTCSRTITQLEQCTSKGFWEMFHIKACLNTWNSRQRRGMGNSHLVRKAWWCVLRVAGSTSCCVITGLKYIVIIPCRPHTLCRCHHRDEKMRLFEIYSEWQMKEVAACYGVKWIWLYVAFMSVPDICYWTAAQVLYV